MFVASLDSSAAKRLVTARSRAVHATPGYLLFWREGALLTQAFDANRLEVRGNPVSVANDVGLNSLTNQGLFSVSDSGTLVFFAGAVGQSELVWVDRAGRRIGEAGPRGIFNSLSLSPDATSVVYDQAEPRNRTLDLWRLDFASGVPFRLTFHPSHDMFPLWSPDGTRIAFNSLREPPPQLYELNANGAGKEKLLLKTNFPKGPSGWSSDGRLLFYDTINPQTGGDIWALPLVGKPEPYPVVRTCGRRALRHAFARRTVAGLHLERDRRLRGVRRSISCDRIQAADFDAGWLRAAVATRRQRALLPSAQPGVDGGGRHEQPDDPGIQSTRKRYLPPASSGWRFRRWHTTTPPPPMVNAS